jgi:hypothetical protein
MQKPRPQKIQGSALAKRNSKVAKGNDMTQMAAAVLKSVWKATTWPQQTVNPS